MSNETLSYNYLSCAEQRLGWVNLCVCQEEGLRLLVLWRALADTCRPRDDECNLPTRTAMKPTHVLLATLLLALPCAPALADSCRKNIQGGEDCRYSDGTTSTSRANIMGGFDTTYSDGRRSSSRSNIQGGLDTRYSDGSSSSSRSNIQGGQDTRYSDGRTSSSRSNIQGGQDTRYSDGSTSSSRSNIQGGQDTRYSGGGRERDQGRRW